MPADRRGAASRCVTDQARRSRRHEDHEGHRDLRTFAKLRDVSSQVARLVLLFVTLGYTGESLLAQTGTGASEDVTITLAGARKLIDTGKPGAAVDTLRALTAAPAP